MRGSLATVCHRCVAGGAQALPRCSAALGAELPGDADRGGASARGAPCLQPWHSQSVQEGLQPECCSVSYTTHITARSGFRSAQGSPPPPSRQHGHSYSSRRASYDVLRQPARLCVPPATIAAAAARGYATSSSTSAHTFAHILLDLERSPAWDRAEEDGFLDLEELRAQQARLASRHGTHGYADSGSAATASADRLTLVTEITGGSWQRAERPGLGWQGGYGQQQQQQAPQAPPARAAVGSGATQWRQGRYVSQADDWAAAMAATPPATAVRPPPSQQGEGWSASAALAATASPAASAAAARATSDFLSSSSSADSTSASLHATATHKTIQNIVDRVERRQGQRQLGWSDKSLQGRAAAPRDAAGSSLRLEGERGNLAASLAADEHSRVMQQRGGNVMGGGQPDSWFQREGWRHDPDSWWRQQQQRPPPPQQQQQWTPRRQQQRPWPGQGRAAEGGPGLASPKHAVLPATPERAQQQDQQQQQGRAEHAGPALQPQQAGSAAHEPAATVDLVQYWQAPAMQQYMQSVGLPKIRRRWQLRGRLTKILAHSVEAPVQPLDVDLYEQFLACESDLDRPSRRNRWEASKPRRPKGPPQQ